MSHPEFSGKAMQKMWIMWKTIWNMGRAAMCEGYLEFVYSDAQV